MGLLAGLLGKDPLTGTATHILPLKAKVKAFPFESKSESVVSAENENESAFSLESKNESGL